MSKAKPRYEVRIRYYEDWHGHGEHFVFERKGSDETEWGTDMAFKLLDYEDEKGVLLSYRALTKIRQLQELNIPFYFYMEG